jgi:hypothetical protein
VERKLTMWTYDGEEWIDEGKPREERTSETPLPLWDEAMPELQVIEHIPSPPPRMPFVPLLPFP